MATSLLGDQSDSGPLSNLLGLFKPFDYSAAYTGSLARDPQTGQADPAVVNAFRQRAMGAAAEAFAQGGMPVPYKGGIPIGSTIGMAGAAASRAGDPLMAARLQAAQAQEALAAAGLSAGQLSLLHSLGPAYQALIDKGINGGAGAAGGTNLPGQGALTPQNLVTGGAKAVSSTTADTSLPPEARALLDTISGPESGGAYNVRYNGGKDATFDGYAAHPQVHVTIPQGQPYAGSTSDAAGRYQFLSSTWNPIAKKYGFTDFSPTTQDQGAWHNAADTYAEKTGRDLLTDLQAGKLEQVQSALRGQWGTLHMGSYAANLAKYTNAPPTQTAAAVPQPPGPGQPTNNQPTPPVGNPPGLLNLPDPTGRAAQLGAAAQPNAPPIAAPPPGSPPPPTPGPQSLLQQPPPGAPPLNPNAQAILAGMNAAPGGGGQVAGPGAPSGGLVPGGALTAPPPQVTQGPAPPPSSLLSQPPPAPPPGAAPGPQPAPAAVPGLLAPQGPPGPPGVPAGPPPVGPPPQLPAPPSSMPPIPSIPNPQATPQQMIAQGIAGISSLTGHPAPEWVQQLAGMPAQMAMEQYKAWVNAQTSMMTERDKKIVEMAAAPYLAAAGAAAKLPYTPERVAPGAGISVGGQPPQWYAPEHQTAFNPATQREEYVTVTKQPDGTSKYDWSGIPAKPSAAETAAGTAAGPYTPAAVPGAPVKAPPGAPPIYPQNPDPAKSIQTPTGTTIPAPTNQVLPQNYSDYGKQQENWNNRREDLVNAQTLSAGAETKIRMMIDAAKVNQMGTGSEARAHLGGLLISLGADQNWVNQNITNVGAVQQFLYGQARETLGTLAAVNKRFTGGEFKITSQSGAGTEYLNEANLPILADDLARVRQLQMVSQDFNRAQTIRYADGGYWNNPESFISQWYQANPLGKIKAQTMQQIGPLAGMTGVPGVPKEAVPTGKTAGGWPVFKMPDGREGTFPGEWR